MMLRVGSSAYAAEAPDAETNTSVITGVLLVY